MRPGRHDEPVAGDGSKGNLGLVDSGQLVQWHGSGTFVAHRVERLEQTLSLLTFFTEDMSAGVVPSRAVGMRAACMRPSRRRWRCVDLMLVTW